MIKFEPFALKFSDQREAELVSEALGLIRCDNAPDALRVKQMTALINKELEGLPK